MSTHSPYDNELAQKMENIAMPNIEMAWADMEKRLVEKEDKKPIPFWFNSCAIVALLGILLFGILYWFYNEKNKTQQKNVKANVIVKDSTKIINNISVLTKKQPGNIIDKTAKDKVVVVNKKAFETNIATSEKVYNDLTNTEQVFDASKKRYKIKSKIKVNITIDENDDDKAKSTIENKTYRNNNTVENKTAEKNKKLRVVKGKSKTNITAPTESYTNDNKENIEKIVKIDSPEIKNSIVNQSIRSEEKIIKTEVKIEIVLPLTKDTVAKKIVATKKRKINLFFNAGIGIQQQLPINGQTNTPYNSLGRKSTLLDYIPSVYARVEKDKKWFFQIEGKYGAPQYNKEFVYEQINVRDTGFLSNFVTITSTALKKSYYHQIPFSFNYYITPKWSIGAGLQWNKFTGALAEKTETIRNDNTQTETILSKIQTVEKLDSNNVFSKQYTLALFETQFKWRRFNFGAKYSFGLSPFITFTLPGNEQQRLTSKTVLMFIKYELWNSKKIRRKNKRKM